jgi:hypothetical protein
MDGPTGSLRRSRSTKSNGGKHDLDMRRLSANCNEAPNQITGADAGGPHQLPMRTCWAARVAQLCRSARTSFTNP